MSDRLFSRFGSFDAVEHLKVQLSNKLRDLPETKLKNTQIDDWVAHFKSEMQVDIPVLDRDSIQGSTTEIQAEVYDRYHFRDEEKIPKEHTQKVTYKMNFSGDPQFFECSGNTYMATFPSASIYQKTISLSYVIGNLTAEALNLKIDKDINEIEGQLTKLKHQFTDWNNTQIERIVRDNLTVRFEKFAKNDQILSLLKYPIKPRTNSPQTFHVPEVRKKIVPAPLPTTTATQSPDPVLLMEHYEHILNVTKNMVKVMECSPKAFHDLDEEALRFHFLVQLNGQYEGMATGETFNYGGKTDILIRYQGNNIFIGECKFWKGPKGYLETIDQILKYVTWRDTKISIFVFCKDTDPSVPLQKIPEITKNHTGFSREISLQDKTAFRFMLKHPGDTSKEIMLTVLVFNIPSPKTN